MSASHATAGRAGIAKSAGAVAVLFRRGMKALGLWYRRRRAIAALQSLSDRALEDMGVDRSEIEAVIRAHLRGTSR